MSIAAGVSATSVKTVAGAENHGQKARSSAVGQGDALGGGGFLALLMSMDPETDLGTDSAAGEEQGAGLASLTVMQDPAPAPAQTVPPSGAQPSPLPLARAEEQQPDMAMLLAQAGMGRGTLVATEQTAQSLISQTLSADPAPGVIVPQANSPRAMVLNLTQRLAMPLANTVAGDAGAASQIADLAPSLAGPALEPSLPLINAPLAMVQNLAMPLAPTATDSAEAMAQSGSLAQSIVTPDSTPAQIVPPPGAQPSPLPLAAAQNPQQDWAKFLAQAGTEWVAAARTEQLVQRLASQILPAGPALEMVAPLPKAPLAMAQNLMQQLVMPLAPTAVDGAAGAEQGAGLASLRVTPDPAPAQIVPPGAQLGPLPLVVMARNPQPDLAMPLAQAGMVRGSVAGPEQIAQSLVSQTLPVDPAPGTIVSLFDAPVAVAHSLPMPSTQAGGGMAVAGGVERVLGQASEIVMPDSSPASIMLPSNPSLAMTQNSRQELVVGTDSRERAIEPAASLTTQLTEAWEKAVDHFLGPTEQPLPLRPSRSKGAELQARAGGSLLESRFSSSMDTSLREPAMLGALVNSSAGDGVLRQLDRPATRSSSMPGGSGVEGVWGQPTLFARAGVQASAAIPDSSMSSLESMVADTLSYWVAQGVQNAELKLDGLGPDPVDVSISLKGDEAHIDFRTDQPEIRQVLEGATAHLKDLLAKEGLVLSGMSVGSSSQQGAGAQEQRHRQGARQADIARVEVAPTEPRPRAIQSLAGAVDIFV